MSAIHSGTCDCNQIELYVRLPEPLSSYSPRACDCDFCSENDLVFLSDPSGSLELLSTISLEHITQGSGQAEFLRCMNCEQIVAVTTEVDGVLIGSVNSDCLYDAELLSVATPVSIHSLSPKDKKARWDKTWMPVMISEPD